MDSLITYVMFSLIWSWALSYHSAALISSFLIPHLNHKWYLNVSISIPELNHFWSRPSMGYILKWDAKMLTYSNEFTSSILEAELLKQIDVWQCLFRSEDSTCTGKIQSREIKWSPDIPLNMKVKWAPNSLEERRLRAEEAKTDMFVMQLILKKYSKTQMFFIIPVSLQKTVHLIILPGQTSGRKLRAVLESK